MTAMRSTLAHAGITALNLFGPGLGLVRLGDARRGFGLLLTGIGASLVLIVLAAVAPTPDFAAWAIVATFALAVALTLYVTAFSWTWRASGERRAPHWWSRWYVLVGICLASYGANSVMVPWGHRYYRSFYIPSEAMLPTLLVNDRIFADMRDHRARPGDIVLFQHEAGTLYIKRVVAIAGDTVMMRDGIPVINGRTVRQVPDGTLPVVFDGPKVARVALETLPGESGAHRVLDTAVTPQDDTAPQRVPPEHVFVLGDNRDNSEDSRFPDAVGGVGMLPIAAIRGRPLFFYWSHDRARIGRAPDTVGG